MTGGFKKRKVAKYAVIFVLVCFLLFSAMTSVMYFVSPKQKLDIEQIKIECEELGGERDEKLSDCIFATDLESPETKESCEQDGGIWYDENNVCIK